MTDLDKAIAKAARPHRRRANYAKTTCIICGRLISESAYSGKKANFSKHVRACEKKHSRLRVMEEL